VREDLNDIHLFFLEIKKTSGLKYKSQYKEKIVALSSGILGDKNRGR